jgi:hypothetical protein
MKIVESKCRVKTARKEGAKRERKKEIISIMNDPNPVLRIELASAGVCSGKVSEATE